MTQNPINKSVVAPMAIVIDKMEDGKLRVFAQYPEGALNSYFVDLGWLDPEATTVRWHFRLPQ